MSHWRRVQSKSANCGNLKHLFEIVMLAHCTNRHKGTFLHTVLAIMTSHLQQTERLEKNRYNATAFNRHKKIPSNCWMSTTLRYLCGAFSFISWETRPSPWSTKFPKAPETWEQKMCKALKGHSFTPLKEELNSNMFYSFLTCCVSSSFRNGIIQQWDK